MSDDFLIAICFYALLIGALSSLADILKRVIHSKKAGHDCRLCGYWDCPYHRCKHEREKRMGDEV